MSIPNLIARVFDRPQIFQILREIDNDTPRARKPELVAQLTAWLKAQSVEDQVRFLGSQIHSALDNEEIWDLCEESDVPWSGGHWQNAICFVAKYLGVEELGSQLVSDGSTPVPNWASDLNKADQAAVLRYWKELDFEDPEDVLFLDMEGGLAVHFYYPGGDGHRGSQPDMEDERFLFCLAEGSSQLEKKLLTRFGLVAAAVSVIVVFDTQSGSEEEAFRKVYKENPFSRARWVTMHPSFKGRYSHGGDLGTAMRGSDTILSKVGGKGKAGDLSLESMERFFGLVRPNEILSNKKQAQDGTVGELDSILALVKKLKDKTATPAERKTVDAYCRWDVWSLYEMAYRAKELV